MLIHELLPLADYEEQFPNLPRTRAVLDSLRRDFMAARVLVPHLDTIKGALNFDRRREALNVTEAVTTMLMHTFRPGERLLVEVPPPLHDILGIQPQGGIAVVVVRHDFYIATHIVEQESGNALTAIMAGASTVGEENCVRLCREVMGAEKEQIEKILDKESDSLSLFTVPHGLRQAITADIEQLPDPDAARMTLMMAQHGPHMEIIRSVIPPIMLVIAARQLGLCRENGINLQPLGSPEALHRGLRGCLGTLEMDGVIAHKTHSTLQ